MTPNEEAALAEIEAYYRNKPASRHDFANEIGCSIEWVRRIERAAIEKMRAKVKDFGD